MNGQDRIRREHFSLVGQKRGSNDCGFFCGMVFSIARQSKSFESMVLASEDVYRARDAYLKPPNPKLGPGTHWLQPKNAPVYLETLGVRGSLEGQKDWRTRSSALATLEELLGETSCHGLMIVTGNHWSAIINPFWIGGPQRRKNVVYDPAPHVVPHSREAHLPEIAAALHIAGPRAVVRVQRTL